MTVDHRRPAVKTKIQSVDSTRPPAPISQLLIVEHSLQSGDVTNRLK